MTKLSDIKSTGHVEKDLHGNVIHTVRDSLIAEFLLSAIAGITILTVMLIIKSYVPIIDAGIYPAFFTLIVPVIHTVIRRIRINMQFPIFLLSVLTSAAFYFFAINTPILEFGSSIANRFYLAAVLIAYTFFTMLYRLKPSFGASDPQFIVFPLIIHIVFWILFLISDKKEIADNLVLHMIIIAILFVIMRQIAVFDAKYYHTIRKSNKPAALLRKQNNKTIIGLIGVIAVSLGVLAIFPVESLSRLLMTGIRAFLGFIFSLFKAHESDYDFDLNYPTTDPGDWGGEGRSSPWIDLAVKAIAIIIIIAVIVIILNAVRILIQNAPKFSKKKETEEDDNLIDTIENIKPEKKALITKGPDFGTGHERRIRKQFYNKTRRAMKKGLPVSSASTPGQIEKVLTANGDKDITPLRQEYEKVRYGKQ